MANYDLKPFYVPKTIALVGMMGAGKSTIGKRLANKLSLKFFDSDKEVEEASGGYSVTRIYEQWGEQAFREVEYKVIERLLRTEPPHVLSTGDGAFISDNTRQLLQEQTVTVWLKAGLETLSARVKNRRERPQLLEGDTDVILERLIVERHPIYATADITVESDDETYQDTVDRIFVALSEFFHPNV